MRRLLVATVVVATVVALFVAVFPTRALLEQRRSRDETRVELRGLVARNRTLEAQASRLRSDSEIERLAREQYNLVRPGEEAYVVLPNAIQPPENARPHVTARSRPVRSWWGRTWDRLLSIF